ncbi:hypothetical protein [Streptomyces sp. NPDC004783]|uniref:hypothetical protein n=1 Tax=unclassified Streptomyces TaxID=2593676 RepID=UPI0033AFB3FC
MTVAVSALAGCTTVQPPPAPGPAAGAAHSSAPRPDGGAERLVRSPARDALDLIGPSRVPDRARRAPSPSAPSKPSARPAPPAARPEPAPRPKAPGGRTGPGPRVTVPAVPPAARGIGPTTDVCSLGERYGGWRPGSREAVICERAYGR